MQLTLILSANDNCHSEDDTANQDTAFLQDENLDAIEIEKNLEESLNTAPMQRGSYLDYHNRTNDANEDKETKRSLLTLSNQVGVLILLLFMLN